MGTRKMKVFVLLAAVCHISQSAPQWLSYAAVHPVASVVTGNSVPVAVGGYKAVAGSNGDLAGPVHEVPGLVPALAVQKQESSGDVSLSTGTGALVHTPVVAHYYGKRAAEADPALLYGGLGLPYAAGVYGYPYAAHVPVTYAVKPLELKTEVTAPTSQSLLLLEDTRLRLEITVISRELSMRFPDSSLPLLSMSRRTPMEEPSLSEPAPLFPTPLSRGKLRPTLLFFMELMDLDMDTTDLDTLPMDMLDIPTTDMPTTVK